MTSGPADLRGQVRRVYSEIAQAPGAEHPVRVGREVAVRAGYDEVRWRSPATDARYRLFDQLGLLVLSLIRRGR
jgi:hypothetical protein